MSDTPTNRQQAEAAGFTVDRCCYPWVAYKGPRFQPTELHYIDTDREAEAERQRDELAAALRELETGLREMRRIPAMPFPDPGAHSWQAYATAVYRAWAEMRRKVDALLARIEEGKS